MCKQASTNTQTVVQNPTIPDWLSTSFQNLATRAQGVSDRPYNVGTQRNVADFTPDQLQAFQQVRQDQGIYQPYMDAATGYAQLGGSPIAAGQIARYGNPFQNMVIDSTLANIQQNNALQAANLRGNAALQGGLGNDRLGVAQAELARNQNLATNQTLATLNAQNYNQALGAAQQDRTAAQTAASQFGNLGSNMQALAAQDASNLMLTGGLQEQKAQQQLDTTTANVASQEQYPFATASWLGGVLQGASPAFTGYSQTTSTPAPSTMQSILGLGALGLGAYMRSDERAKDNMRPVGETFDGQTIYAYDEGGPTKLGLSAQEVMTVKPEAVVEEPTGLLAVNYDVAVSDAEPRQGFNDGGLTLSGNYSINKNRIRAMGQPTDGGMAGPYPDANTGALSQQAGMMMSMANPVKRLKAPTPTPSRTVIYDEAKSLAKDMNSNFQLGGDMVSAGRKGLAHLGGYSVKDEAYGPPVPEGLANGGRVGYNVGGMAFPAFGSFRAAQQDGMPTPYGASNIVPLAPTQRAPGLAPVANRGLAASDARQTIAGAQGSDSLFGGTLSDSLGAVSGLPDVLANAQDGPGTTGLNNPTGAMYGPPVPAGLAAASDARQTIAGAQGSNSLLGGFGYGSNPGLGAALMAAAPGIASGRNFAEGLARGMAGGVQGYNQWEIAEQRKAQEALQNRIAEEKLRMMTEEFKQRQAQYLENKPIREANVIKAQREAAGLEGTIAERTRVADRLGLTGDERQRFILSGDAKGGGKVGLNPIYGVDKDGNPVVMQPTDSGRVIASQMPDGVRISREPIKMDAGTHFVLMDPVTRQVIGQVPKNNQQESQDKARGKEIGEAQGKAVVDLPKVESEAQSVLGYIEAVEKDANLPNVLGYAGQIPITVIPRNRTTLARVEQLKGKAFLSAFESLKGAGAITETEGAKATAALARLNDTGQDEAGYREALADFKKEVNRLLANARRRAQNAQTATPKTNDGWSVEVVK